MINRRVDIHEKGHVSNTSHLKGGITLMHLTTVRASTFLIPYDQFSKLDEINLTIFLAWVSGQKFAVVICRVNFCVW